MYWHQIEKLKKYSVIQVIQKNANIDNCKPAIFDCENTDV